MRHFIQRTGHEFLPVVFTLVGISAALLFYLNNAVGNPPIWAIIPALIALAISTEWLTFTFLQDMQDAVTARAEGAWFCVVKALFTTAVSVYIFASATSDLWAPKGAHFNSVTWAWVLAVGVFGSQFLLKLTPEKRQHSLVNIALAVEQWAKDKTGEEQARIAGAMYNALAGSPVLALPAPAEEEITYQPVNQYSGKMVAVSTQQAQAKQNGHQARGNLQQP